jgi:hypothetical protein
MLKGNTPLRKLFFGLMMATAMVGTVSAGDSIVGHFARVYDKNHLAEHPDQLVKEVRDLISRFQRTIPITLMIFSYR